MELYFSHALDLSEDLIKTLQELTIASNCCNGAEVKELDLSAFANLISFVVRESCFTNVEKCFLVGLHKLERVKIDKNSFVKSEYDPGDGVDTSRHFRLSDCENMKELAIDGGSFLDYSVCEISNVPLLESIQFGEQSGHFSGCFYWNYIKLRSDKSVIMSFLDEQNLKSVHIGSGCFCACSRVVIESECLVSLCWSRFAFFNTARLEC